MESFFRFFSPPPVPDEDVDVKDEDLQELQEMLEADYDIGCAAVAA